MKEFMTEQEVDDKIIEYMQEDSLFKHIFTFKNQLLGIVLFLKNVFKRVIYEYSFLLLSKVFLNGFLTTADEDGLKLHLRDRGLEEWKQAKKAIGVIRLGSSTPLTKKIKIPQLTIVGTNEQNGTKQFILKAASSIDQSTPIDERGYYTTDIEIISLHKGAEYNLPVNCIDTLYTNIDGIDIIYNPDVTFDGRDKEDIEEVRNRCRVYDNIEKKYDAAWFESETLNFEFVKDAAVVPRYQGRGTLGIAIITPAGTPTPEELNTIYTHFNNTDVDPAGIYNVVPFGMETYNWNAAITLYFLESHPTEQELTTLLTGWFATLKRGQRITINQIESLFISGFSNVHDVRIENFSSVETPIEAYPQLGEIQWGFDVFNI